MDIGGIEDAITGSRLLTADESEIERLRNMLAEQGLPFADSGDGGVKFWLGGNECWANPTDDGGLYGGVGFLPWMCCHMKDAEHALSWCRWRLGIEVSDA